MKVFFIFTEKEAKERNIGALISAFAGIESIGHTNGMMEAIDVIQTRFPETVVSDETLLGQEPELLSILYNNNKEELIILPKNPKIKEKSIYIGLDFSMIEPESFSWVIHSIQRMINECNGNPTQ